MRMGATGGLILFNKKFSKGGYQKPATTKVTKEFNYKTSMHRRMARVS